MGVHFATVLVFAIFAVVIVTAMLFVGNLVRPHAPTPGKSLPYECGEKPIGSAFFSFNPRFSLVALVFVIFEVEIALVYPVAAVYREAVEAGTGLAAFVAIAAFVGVLAAGLVVVWARGDFDWVRALRSEKTTADQDPDPIRRAA